MEEIDMRLIIILTVIIYWLLPVDIAPGPLDDIVVTVAGLILSLYTHLTLPTSDLV